MPKSFPTVILFLLSGLLFAQEPARSNTPKAAQKPLRVGVIGLVHTHVHWLLGREDRGDVEIVGIVEPNRVLAQKYSQQHGYSMDIVYSTIEEMVEAQHPEAVTAFNTIYDHLSVVEYCAPRGIHVMVEKPLAVNLDHARQMAGLAQDHGIHLLTNYETSWYGSNAAAYQILDDDKVGDLRRLIFYTGHPGPIEIGCNQEFVEWLIDPVQNGGGALTDFGCYGANLATWLMQGEVPISVTCITQQIKPQLYPEVEDDATILITYPKTQVIVQASWNWSHNRKEMELYGTHGYVFCKNGTDMQILEDEAAGPYEEKATPLPTAVNDPFAYLAQVVQNDLKVEAWDVSALENNVRVMQILEAARISAETGKTQLWTDLYGEAKK